jgi:CubicO group peptidase (beta-lactamase class C family)
LAIPHVRPWRSVAPLILSGASACTITLVASSSAKPSATSLVDAAAKRIQSFVAARQFQGSVLIARHDTVLFERTIVFSGVPPQTTPRYGIGSITKTFTAAAIQRLEQHGKLRLEDRLSRFVPDFPKGDSITIEQLLTHTAGIPDYYTDAEYPKNRAQPMTPQRFAEWLATKRLEAWVAGRSPVCLGLDSKFVTLSVTVASLGSRNAAVVGPWPSFAERSSGTFHRKLTWRE